MQHDSQTIELVLIAAVAAAMLFQSVVLIALFLAMRKAARSASEQLASLHSTAMPLIEDSHALLKRLTPKIEKTTDDLTALTHSLRAQTAEVQSATNEIITRVRGQVGRLDALLTNALDTVDRASTCMAEAVAKPVRQVSAILASAKAIIESLRAVDPGPRTRPVNTPGDNDMFV